MSLDRLSQPVPSLTPLFLLLHLALMLRIFFFFPSLHLPLRLQLHFFITSFRRPLCTPYLPWSNINLNTLHHPHSFPLSSLPHSLFYSDYLCMTPGTDSVSKSSIPVCCLTAFEETLYTAALSFIMGTRSSFLLWFSDCCFS